jgi:hypothetical protein
MIRTIAEELKLAKDNGFVLRTVGIVQVFIQGVPVSMTSRQTRLRDNYSVQ